MTRGLSVYSGDSQAPTAWAMKQGSEGRGVPLAAWETAPQHLLGVSGQDTRGHTGRGEQAQAKEQVGGTIGFQPKDFQSRAGLQSLPLGKEGPWKSKAMREAFLEGQSVARMKRIGELLL